MREVTEPVGCCNIRRLLQYCSVETAAKCQLRLKTIQRYIYALTDFFHSIEKKYYLKKNKLSVMNFLVDCVRIK